MALAGHRSGGNQLRARNDAPLIEPLQVHTPECLIEAPAIVGKGVALPALFGGLPGLAGGILARCYELEEYPARV